MTRIISIVGGMQPTAPTIGTATAASDTTATVAFTASSYIGKGTITYTATSSPGGLTATGASSPITVTGLTTGTAYTFTVVGNTNYGVASVASAASNSITPAALSSYESIATTTVSSPVATVTFSSIPATFTHLQLRAVLKTTEPTATEDNTNLYFNGDTTHTNYRGHWLRGDGTTISASTIQASGYQVYTGVAPSSHSSLTSMFGATIIDILDYTNPNKLKTVRIFNGDDCNNASLGFIGMYSSMWISGSAITSMTFNLPGGANWAQYSKFALYGIKGV
jgi:hypothetical protein